MNEITLAEMLAEVNRELGLRRALYPGWIASKKLKQEKADRCIAVMEAVRDNLAHQLKGD